MDGRRQPTPTPALVSPMESPWRLSRQRQPRQQPDASRSRVLAVSSLGPGPRDRESAPHGAGRRPVIAGSTMSDTLHPAGRSTVHGAPPLSAFQAGFGLPAGCLRPRAGPVPTAAASIPRRRTTRMGATRSGYLSACPARVAAALRTIGGQASTFSGALLGGLAVTTASGSPRVHYVDADRPHTGDGSPPLRSRPGHLYVFQATTADSLSSSKLG